MGLILWIILGAIAGWIASIVMKTNASQGTLMDIFLGILGSMVGGLVMGFFGYPGVTGFNLYSFLVGIIGACIIISIGRMVVRK